MKIANRTAPVVGGGQDVLDPLFEQGHFVRDGIALLKLLDQRDGIGSATIELDARCARVGRGDVGAPNYGLYQWTTSIVECAGKCCVP